MKSPTPKKNLLVNDKKSKADRLDGFLESVLQNNKDMINTFKSTQSLLSNMDNHECPSTEVVKVLHAHI